MKYICKIILKSIILLVVAQNAIAGNNRIPRQAKALQIIDSHGRFVGRASGNTAVRKLENTMVALPMRKGGFAGSNPPKAVDVTYYYTTNDCSGQPYLGVEGFPREAVISDDVAYFGGNPEEYLVMTASKRVSILGENVTPFECNSFYGVGLWVGPVTSVDLAPLGFVGPFDVR